MGLWGSSKRTVAQTRRLARFLTDRGIAEEKLTTGEGEEGRRGVTTYYSEEEDQVLQEIAAFYGLRKGQLLRALGVALIESHRERMQLAKELGYGAAE